MSFDEDGQTDSMSGKAKHFFEVYLDYNKTLRTWLVAFGVGAPAAILIHPDLFSVIKGAGCAPLITISFLLGTFFQIIVAFINKYNAWLYYDEEANDSDISLGWKGAITSLGSMIGLDAWLDILSFVSYAMGVVVIFISVFSG